MEAQTVDTLPPVAADHDPVRCLLAIELSKKSWIVAIATALSDKISRYTLDGCDWEGLLELMERVRTRVAREVGRVRRHVSKVPTAEATASCIAIAAAHCQLRRCRMEWRTFCLGAGYIVAVGTNRQTGRISSKWENRTMQICI